MKLIAYCKILIIAFIALLASACNKDSDTSWEYGSKLIVESSSPDSDAEAATIRTAFETALGGKTFSIDGEKKIADLRVIGICQTVEERLDALKWSGSYTYEVYNLTSGGELIYSHTFASKLVIKPDPDAGDDDE